MGSLILLLDTVTAWLGFEHRHELLTMFGVVTTTIIAGGWAFHTHINSKNSNKSPAEKNEGNEQQVAKVSCLNKSKVTINQSRHH